MRSFARFLLVLSCVAPFCAANAVVSQTAGSNLTAYNGESGSTNNNRWNNLTNSRSAGTGSNATADFGNCNAVIMRCAQPKCGSGCTDLSVTAGIVSGCVQSNASCKQYGDDLVQYISAQLVAQSTAKANAEASAAQTAAANAAAQQNAQQMAQMQQQMQQMQSQMAQQNAQQMAQLQSALEEQKQLTANAIAEANAARESNVQPVAAQTASVSDGLSDAQIMAAQSGVSADILAREQVSGQILSSIENAETQLKALKATMNDAFSYAGCDSRGNNCTGPKRVKMFKQKAEGFFDPYESVLDELYDALILAQSVGVDITDIYMMLNGSCNVWGQYLCSMGGAPFDSNGGRCTKWGTRTKIDNKGNTITEYDECLEHEGSIQVQYNYYTKDNCDAKTGKSKKHGMVRGGHECVEGQVVPPEDDMSCTLNKTIVDDPNNPVQRNWLWAEADENGMNIRVGCASSALESSVLFRNRKKQASIDIETLQKIIAQDAPAMLSKNRNSNADDAMERVKYCMVGDKSYPSLQKWVATKTLPTNVCMTEPQALRQIRNEGVLTASGERAAARTQAASEYNKCTVGGYADCKMITAGGDKRDFSKPLVSEFSNGCCASVDAIMCVSYGDGMWNGGVCQCKNGQTYMKDVSKCMTWTEYCHEQSSEPNEKQDRCIDCDLYCTDVDTKKQTADQCKVDGTSYTKLKNNQKCLASWSESERKCKCEIK